MTKQELIKEIKNVSNILEQINKANNNNIIDARVEQHKEMLLQYLKELNLSYDVYKILDID